MGLSRKGWSNTSKYPSQRLTGDQLNNPLDTISKLLYDANKLRDERNVIAKKIQEKNEEIEPCEKCGDIGYHGRQGAYELLEINDAMKEIVLAGADPTAIRQQMRTDGMQTLQKDGLRLVEEKLTSLEELQRVFSGKKKKRPRRR